MDGDVEIDISVLVDEQIVVDVTVPVDVSAIGITTLSTLSVTQLNVVTSKRRVPPSSGWRSHSRLASIIGVTDDEIIGFCCRRSCRRRRQ